MQERINKFNSVLNDEHFTTKVAFHLTRSSLETLQIVNKIVDKYLEHESDDLGEILLNVFGMLQGLFIGIDALYSLSYGVTNKKWSVNVNNNPQLREIKYVRNDVVGHPTKRTYTGKKIGYCDLDLENTKYFELVYQIAIPTDRNEDIQKHHVDLRKTINSYNEESKKILDEIFKRMLLENKNTTEYFSEMVYDIFSIYKKGIRDTQKLSDMRKRYCRIFNLDEYSKDRFLWRITVIEELFHWDVESHDEIITYLINYQLDKLYHMSNQLDEIDFSGIELKYKFPKNAMYYSKHIDERGFDKEVLNDNNHPLFDITLEQIGKTAKGNRNIVKVNNMFIKNKKNQTRIYALGSIL